MAGLRQVPERVHWSAVQPDFQMQVRARAAASVAHAAYDLSLLHHVTRFDRKGAQVGVQRLQAITVVQDNIPAEVRRRLRSYGHPSIGGSSDGSPKAGLYVDPSVAAFAEVRGYSAGKRPCQHALATGVRRR